MSFTFHSSLSTYDNLFLAIYGTTNATGNGINKVRINNNSLSNYDTFGFYTDQNYAVIGNDAILSSPGNMDRTVNANVMWVKLTNCKNAGFTDFLMTSRVYDGTNDVQQFSGIYKVSEAVSSLVFLNSGGNWSGGTYYVWGS